MYGKGTKLSPSEVKVVQIISAACVASGSSTAIDATGFTDAMLVVNVGDVGTSLDIQVKRANASGGTFAGFGASVPQFTAAGTKVRSFKLDSSNMWLRAEYAVTGNTVAGAHLILGGARSTPVDQDSNTTPYSTVVGG